MPRKKASGPLNTLRVEIEDAKKELEAARKETADAKATDAQKDRVTKTAARYTTLRAKYKREAFKDLATGRGVKALKALNNIQFLANRSLYTFDKDDVEQLSEALLAKTNEVISAFETALTEQAPATEPSLPFAFK